MWELLVGTAAANKAISVGVGLSVLLGAAGTAEVTGVGPAVRDIVRPVTGETDTNEGIEIVAEVEVDEIKVDDVEIQELDTEEETEDVDQPKNNNEQHVIAAEDAPGNLVWHLRAGEFKLRGILVEDSDGLAIRTAGPGGETVEFPVDAEVVAAGVPGANSNRPQNDTDTDSESAMEYYVGYLVSASGECVEPEMNGEDDEAVESECMVTSLRILGHAGQSDDDETENSEALLEDDESNEEESDDDESDEDDRKDKDHGKPEHAGGQGPNKPARD